MYVDLVTQQRILYLVVPNGLIKLSSSYGMTSRSLLPCFQYILVPNVDL